MKRRTIELFTLEAASLAVDARETIAEASRVARLLAHAGQAADEAAVACYSRAEPDEMRAQAGRLRGSVLHCLMLAAELQAQAGRLEQIASVREARVDHDA
jgi:hypothetical protein